VRPALTKNQGPSLWGYVYVREEPAKDPAALLSALERLCREVGLTPTKMMVTTPIGRVSRPHKLTDERLREAVASDSVGSTVLSWARKDQEELTVRYYLRHHHPVDTRFQAPALHYTFMPLPADPALRHRRLAAVETFLLDASLPFVPLHGAIAAAYEHDHAAEEINMSAEARFAPDGRPLRHRTDFDQLASEALWTRARRLYWTTLLGPELAATAGGAGAARAAGAARVEDRHGCLIVQSTDDVADSLAFDWHARTRNLRRWLWPHTIQNPGDGPVT
jgi:hypothetical protein